MKTRERELEGLKSYDHGKTKKQQKTTLKAKPEAAKTGSVFATRTQEFSLLKNYACVWTQFAINHECGHVVKPLGMFCGARLCTFDMLDAWGKHGASDREMRATA